MGSLAVDAPAASGAAAPGPVVLLDGAPWAGAWVRRMRATGPVDRREAELVVRREPGAWDAAARRRLRRLSGKAVTIAQPLALAGGESRLFVLMTGRLHTIGERLDARHDELTLPLACDWSRLLEQRVRRNDLQGATQWHVADLIGRLNAILGLGLRIDLLDRHVREARLMGSITSPAEAGAMLTALCRRYGLAVKRTLRWNGHGVEERRNLRVARRGRGVSLRRGQAVSAGGVEAALATLSEARPIRLVAEAAGEVIESTFDLQPGWGDENLHEDDAAYGKTTSGDFDALANAFRLWVLNEDGAFEGVAAFDARAFFGEPRPMEARPLRFGEALTRDGAGRSVGVVIETSTDGGQTWSRYGGLAAVLDDRAGVYLDDDALDAAWLTAVRAGDGRVRVTATLRNTLPLMAERWRGNPFAGAFAEQRHRLGTRFERRRVAAGSRYFDAVRAGEREADERDDRAAMADWLTSQARLTASGPGDGTRVRLRTTGVTLGVSVGDRLMRIGDRPLGDGGGLGVNEIEHQWDVPASVVVVA